MARFFFDTDDGKFVRDDVGCEFRDAEEAEANAICALTEMACDKLPKTIQEIPLSVEVRNEAGPLFQVRLVVEVTRATHGSAPGFRSLD
jgi:hypothetical protein